MHPYFDGERQAASFGDLNRHGQDSWALDHRSIDWVSRDEMGYNKSINTELFEYSDRDEYQRIILRASGDDNYPARQNGQLMGQHVGSAHVRDEFVQYNFCLLGDRLRQNMVDTKLCMIGYSLESLS